MHIFQIIGPSLTLGESSIELLISMLLLLWEGM